MFTRTALAALLAAIAAGTFTAAAPAAFAPTLTLQQSAGTTAGSSSATGVDVNLQPFGSDSAKDLAISFPAGFLINLQTDGGVCLTTKTPIAACRLGGGTVNGIGGIPVSLYLVAPPKTADIAGVALSEEGGFTSVGDLTLQTAPALGLTISFRFLPPGVAELKFTLESPRLPTTCGSEQFVAAAAASWQGSVASVTAPLSVTGCESLPFAPKLTASAVKADQEETNVAVTFTQGAGESAATAFSFGIPTGMKLNRILLPCFSGTKCPIGTASATSPLLPPSALTAGSLTLAGTLNGASLYSPISGAALTLAFPAPYGFQLIGPVNLGERVISYSGLPDIPMSSITFSFTGTNAGSAFTSNCAPSGMSATATPQSGNPTVKLRSRVPILGCLRRPKTKGSLKGLGKAKPHLLLNVSRDEDPEGIASLTISLPKGLSFRRGAISGSHLAGLRVSGTTVKSVRLLGGSLRLAFAGPATSVSLSSGSSLIGESASLASLVAHHRAAPRARVRIVDAHGTVTIAHVR